MSFLYPQFLLGLLALSIPILIHLFNFRKAKKVYFSNNQFLQLVREASSSKLRLKHWLVLLSRLFFVAFLVFTFTQPFIPAKEEQLDGNDVLIYLDNSMSMSNESRNGVSGLEEGLTYVNSLLSLYPKGTNYIFLTNEFSSSSKFFKNGDEVKELVTETHLSGVSRDFNQVLSRLQAESEKFDAQNADFYFISDFQKTTVGEPQNWNLRKGANYHYIPVEFNEISNVFVDTVFLNNPFLIAHENNTLSAVLRNEGNSNLEDLEVRLFINEVQYYTASLTLMVGDSKTIHFNLPNNLPDHSKFRLSFEEFPVTFDNDFYFNLDRKGKIRVAEVHSRNASPLPGKAFGNTQLFEFRAFTEENVNYNELSQSNLIILNEVDKLDAPLRELLEDFISLGKSVVVIPSSNPRSSTYSYLEDIRIKSFTAFSAPKQNLASLDLENPFFENIFENREEEFEMPLARPYMKLQGGSESLISYKTGEPFLLRGGIKDNVYFFATPFRDAFTSFQKHAIFVPVLYRIASFSKEGGDQLYYSVTDPFVMLGIERSDNDDVFKLKRPGAEIIPVQRSAAQGLFLELPKDVLIPGFYDLSLRDELKGLLSFNYDKRESYPDQFHGKDLKVALAHHENVSIYESKDAMEFFREMKSIHSGVELWRLCLLLALAFLFFEILLIRFL
ncbi:BatA domain-containing protein [Xanthovirga aplysinae]|uniref:BatA domain-containing protein n=1 Tax=Xanthovirga aplysinae TaxID=2529853 RepID=UPI0012BC15B3|nr:BatA domain-containing protein [Xanthovirga aplysinae]MTI32533.1 hypothetical protein [Xanthovirga aplysinae]